MEITPYPLTLTTPYGEATFGVYLNPTGKVTDVELPFTGLPDSVYKLTYGGNWQEVRRYFAALAATLPYRIAASGGNRQYPQELSEVVGQLEPTAGTHEYGAFWRKHVEWMGLFEFGESKLNRRLKKFVVTGPHPAFEPYLLPYLQSLFAVSSERTEALLWQAIGALATERAREVLLDALESEGRHPFTSDILRALENFADRDTLVRLSEVYRAGKFNVEELEVYLLSLPRFADAFVITHLGEVLRKNAEQVEAIVVALRAAGVEETRIAAEVFGQFEREEDYYVLDLLVRAANVLDVPEYRIDLQRLNRKMDHPAYLELPPVNWPQQLESGWRQIIEQSTHGEVMDVVQTYLSRTEPRLQRNAVLQLKYYRSLPDRTEGIPYPIERRLRELLSSPFDKVYVEILNILGERPLELAERKQLFVALLEVSIRSRYRTVVLKAMYRVGKGSEWREYAREYYLHRLQEAESFQIVEQIAAALPYLDKYLGGTQRLSEAVARQQQRAETR